MNNKENKISLFGEYFIKSNNNKCKIVINHKKYEITRNLNEDNDNNKNCIKLKLKLLDDLILINQMFGKCPSLISCPDLSNLNINKVDDLGELFCGCSSLKYSIQKIIGRNFTLLKFHL